MRVNCAAFFAGTVLFAAQPTTAIKLDQAGYLPSSPKIAAITVTSAASFSVRRADTGAVAYSGDLGRPALDADSGDRVQTADFTKLAAPGRYYLDVRVPAGAGTSKSDQEFTTVCSIWRCAPI